MTHLIRRGLTNGGVIYLAAINEIIYGHKDGLTTNLVLYSSAIGLATFVVFAVKDQRTGIDKSE
jgi:hypothetical protein